MKVKITNNTEGPRVVTTMSGGQVTINPNTTSPEVHVADHEVARYEMRDGFEVEKLGTSPANYQEALAERQQRKQAERVTREGSDPADADTGEGTEESNEGASGRRVRRKKAGARKTR